MVRRPKGEDVPAPDQREVPDPSRRTSDIALVEIAKIQADGEHLKRDVGEMRTDMRDLRDRMARLEVRVDHLPSKEFIVTVTVIALGIIGALVTIAPKLQGMAGTAPATLGAPPNAQGTSKP
jgi:hypothetical protein